MGYNGPVDVNAPSGNAAMWEYGYRPSLGLGIVGVITFLAVAGPHLWWFVTKRGTRSVHGLFFFAAIIEALGYGARLYSHRKPFNGMSFLLGIYLVQVATILITAAFYKSIQRIIKYFPDGRRLSPMRPRSLITLFVILDVLWVVFQIAGQYFVAAAKSYKYVGKNPTLSLGTSGLVFLAGNVIQAITIIIVSVFGFVIYRRSARALENADPTLQYPYIHPLLIQLFISFGLFFIRLIVRIAEGGQGLFDGYAPLHEWVFAVFEYVPIFLILVLWAVKPLYKFIWPLGHRHGEGAHVTDDIAVAHASHHSSEGSASGHEHSETKA